MKLAIIGVGLIGGSLGLCLKDKLGDKIFITGLCRTEKSMRRAMELGAVDLATADLEKVVGVFKPARPADCSHGKKNFAIHQIRRDFNGRRLYQTIHLAGAEKNSAARYFLHSRTPHDRSRKIRRGSG